MSGPPQTIFALSSGAPPAAIAVVRVSGPHAGAALESLAGPLPSPRHATLRTLHHPSSREPLDRALLLWFPGPASATGEDLAELHLHGGRAVVRAVLDALRALPGLRDAAPGEFTRRAFENGALDLAEAEGLADLLEAETDRQRRHALAAAGGALGRLIAGWQERLTGAAALVEAELDHADEDDVSGAGQGARTLLRSLADEIDRALAGPPAERLRQGLRVVLAGPPNSGKSTLLNALAGRELAIISPIPGTTRDLVTAPLALDGIALELTDTAGLRETDDAVECIGVARAREALERADLVLWLGEPEEAPWGNVLLIAPKADLMTQPRSSRVETRGAGADASTSLGMSGERALENSARSDVQPEPFVSSVVETPAPASLEVAGDERGGGQPITVSALTGQGLSTLRAAIRARADQLLGGENELLLNARQRARVAATRDELAHALASPDLLLQAEHLRAARHQLAALTGHEEVEQMLDALFGRFCIGK